MQIPIDTGVLDVHITWLEPDLLELNIVETRDCGYANACERVYCAEGESKINYKWELVIQ